MSATAVGGPAAVTAGLRWRVAVALGALTSGTFLFVTTETLPVGLLSAVGADFGVRTSTVGLLVTVYALVVVVASIPLTKLTRRWRRRPLLGALLVVYVVASLATAAAGTWTTLVAARVVTATSQALFWSIVVPVAASLVSEVHRGRAVALVLSGSSLATVAGVPLGTWIGQQAGWRCGFVALAVLGAVTLAMVVVALPPSAAGDLPAARGEAPDRRLFCVLVLVTSLVTTGIFVFFTYVSPYLTQLAGVSVGLLTLVFLLRGLAGLGGVIAAGALADRRPRAAVRIPVLVQTATMFGLVLWGSHPAVAVAGVVLTGYTFAAFTTPLATRAMTVAPGRVDLAVAAVSTAVNVGITAGAFLGGVVFDAWGPAATAVAGAVLSSAGLALLALDRRPACDVTANLGVVTTPRFAGSGCRST